MTPEPTALPEHELLARVFRTLGDPTRLRILEALIELGEASQRDLIQRVGITQSRASEHLGTLAWCGFIRSQRVGRHVRYVVVGGTAESFLRLARAFLYDHDEAVGGCQVLFGTERVERGSAVVVRPPSGPTRVPSARLPGGRGTPRR